MAFGFFPTEKLGRKIGGNGVTYCLAETLHTFHHKGWSFFAYPSHPTCAMSRMNCACSSQIPGVPYISKLHSQGERDACVAPRNSALGPESIFCEMMQDDLISLPWPLLATQHVRCGTLRHHDNRKRTIIAHNHRSVMHTHLSFKFLGMASG